jgi:hypothetical protein
MKNREALNIIKNYIADHHEPPTELASVVKYLEGLQDNLPRTFADITFAQFCEMGVIRYNETPQGPVMVWTYGLEEHCLSEDDGWIGIEQYMNKSGNGNFWVVRVCQHYMKTNDFNAALRYWYDWLAGEEFPIE